MPKAKTPREPATRRRPVFPGPGHDHDRCSTDAMAVAEALCAYEIIERLAFKGPRPAPITAYRALEFLRENGLVHRIESRNAFVACVHNHAASSFVVFLICERCGAVGEASSNEVTATLTSAARAAGFTPTSPVIELTGICTHCR